MAMDIVDELEARMGTVYSGAYIAMRKGAKEIRRLRQWIAEEGARTNTCTYNVLGEVCANCECHRKPPSN